MKDQPKPSREEKLAKLASQVVIKIFGNYLSPAACDGLTRSVVRQWQRHGGHAALFTPTHNIWIGHLENPDGTGVVRTHEEPGNVALAYVKRAQLNAAAGLDLMQQLNLNGEAQITNRHGKRIHFTVDPQAHKVHGKPMT